MKTFNHIILFTLLALMMSNASARPIVAVTVPAQAWLVKQIAGEGAEILTMVPSGHEPESAQPGPRKLSHYQQADVHFTVGDPAFSFETRYISPYRKKAEPASWLSMYDIAGEIAPAYRLKGLDPHLWTSPRIMLASANALVQILVELDPQNTDLYRNNVARLQATIASLDRKLTASVGRRSTDKLLVYHPAWGHFCQDYGLQQLAIENEGKAPGAGSLSSLFTRLEKDDINFIVSSPGADRRIAAMIAEQFRISLVLINPMDTDWMRMMLEMNKALEQND